ncbi:MAG TPA: protein kinase, partial [Candidatus Polarisedimenticolaceae bacterium]|nr:protein kinase [Candidatus Polarisedimenticolaceae bacterium]
MARSSLDRYERIRPLGEGGAGRVWLVRDRLLGGRLVALKALGGGDTARSRSLRDEFFALATLRHPNLAEVYEFHDGESPCFTLEYVDGTDLAAFGRSAPAPVLLELIAEALRALAFLHDFTVFHRDVKPANLLVRREPRLGSRLVLLDFGLALIDGTREAGPAGTLPYLAPELFQGTPAGRRSDLYGLAAVIHEVVLGEPPVSLEDDRAIGDFVTRVTSGERRPRVWPDRVPDGLRLWLEMLLATEPGARPASAAEALARLNSLVGTGFPAETHLTRTARLESGAPEGRDETLCSLTDRIGDARGPDVILLAGEAGSGKTRLLAHLAARGIRDGLAVRWHLGPGNEPATGSDRATLVCLDDPERLGSETVDGLCRLARGESRADGRVIATVRAREVGEPTLRRLLDDRELLANLAVVELPPLDRRGIAALAGRLFPGETADSARVAWLEQHSEGNAAALVALLVDEAWENRRTLAAPVAVRQS